MDLVPTGGNLVSQFIWRKFDANLNFISDKELVKKEGGSVVGWKCRAESHLLSWWWKDGAPEQSPGAHQKWHVRAGMWGGGVGWTQCGLRDKKLVVVGGRWVMPVEDVLCLEDGERINVREGHSSFLWEQVLCYGGTGNQTGALHRGHWGRWEWSWLETICPSISEMKGKLEVGCRFFIWIWTRFF